MSVDGKTQTDVERCSADSDIEEPVLSRDGKSVLFLGCWNKDAPDGGEYAVKAYIDGRIVQLNMNASAGVWIDGSQAVISDSVGTVHLVDFSESPARVSVVKRLESDVRTVDVNPSGRDVVALSARKEGSLGTGKTYAIVISLQSGSEKQVPLPERASAAFWKSDDELVVEAGDQWLTVDTATARTIDRRPRPAESQLSSRAEGHCRLIDSVDAIMVGWCAEAGRVVGWDVEGKASTIVTVSEDGSSAAVSIASDLVADSIN
ncbi:hypothetical protein [Nonomuraea sp. KM90]|uniref:hypothetical protein n=1 Tax=Nonomuraea sp. KM90 TaxID=3457428 RepID=UPI003FCC6173